MRLRIWIYYFITSENKKKEKKKKEGEWKKCGEMYETILLQTVWKFMGK